jgi:2,4-dienoyl-CoA reductase-like NADH-dependent reductase (Old Yellow Enzyme family)
MNDLFKPAAIGGMETKNRFVRSGTWEGMASEDGEATDALIELYGNLSKGGVGLICTGFAYVNKKGRAVPRMLGIDDNALIPSLKKLADKVHESGGKICIQLTHGGSQSFVDTGSPAEAPSGIQDRVSGKMPEELSKDAIKRVIQDFAAAAKRAKTAGFDAVQIHACHGFLLSEFLSPYCNRRTDEYGGAIENRAKIIYEIYGAARDSVGKDFPVMVKINSSDFDGAGLSTADAAVVCKSLSDMGIDAIELSGGTLASGELSPMRGGIDSPEKEAYFKNEAKEIRPLLKCPLILVGGMRSLPVMEELFSEGTADFFSLSRPLISEPGLIKRWGSGNREKARCISCGKCGDAAFNEGNLYCVNFSRS